MKKVIILFLLCLFMGLSPSIQATNSDTIPNNDPSPVELLDVKSAIVMEVSTKAVLFAYNENVKAEPASMTKIMTMKLVLDAINRKQFNWNDILTTSEYASDMGGSQIFLAPNEKMSVNDLYKSMVIASANDAAVVLAEKVSGTEQNFAKLMNSEAQKLGCKNTHFSNATGLPIENHFTTCYDMAIISCELLNCYLEDTIKYSSMYESYVREDTNNPFWLVNTNKLLKSSLAPDGLKTGWTETAGYCITVTKEENGMRLVSVVMGGKSAKCRNLDTIILLIYSFGNYELQLISPKESIVEINSSIGIVPTDYEIITTEPIARVIKKGSDGGIVTNKIKLFDKIENLLNEENVGIIETYVDNELILSTPLRLREKHHKANFIEVLLNIFKSFF